MLDLLTALSFNDSIVENGVDRVYGVLCWTLVAVLLANAIVIGKESSMRWRVAHTPSISTQTERREVAILQDLDSLTMLMRHAPASGKK